MPLPPALPPPTLEVFYSPDCAPCRLELPIVAEIARQDGTHVRVVILNEEAKARADLREVLPDLESAAESRITASPGSVLRAAGDANGILPYARAVGASGEVCAKWAGRLTLLRARRLLEACARLIP